MSDIIEEEVDFYETTIEDYASTIGALPTNTADTPYDVVITDGENLYLKTLAGYIKSTARYVKIRFEEKVLQAGADLSDSFGGTSASVYLVECDLSALDCAVVLDVSRMFQYCTGLKNVTLSNFVSVTDSVSMFKNCTALTEIDVSIFNNVINASTMFNACTALTKIDISKMISLYNAYSMFEGCTALTELTVAENINNAGRMFYGCTHLTTVKNFKWHVDEMTTTTESEEAENAMPNCFENCTSLAHIYYFADDDSAIQPKCDEWRLYKKTGASLKSYDVEGTEQSSDNLEENTIVPIGKTLALLFDTQSIDHTKIIEKPYLYANPDGSLFDAGGENYALLAKDPEKAVTNLEHFAKLSASKKLVIPITSPSEEDLTSGCMWIE
ncbi:MAG: leucine-rich repeat protein [Treponema sp.]|nr:leucine-rich repeat protein [Treponema sp.]MBR0124298.1 leucine-rich repeat protein [Treponema sp.]MBR0477373.1 leucine-rich repeat protein [Treponema sp.]